MNSTNMSKRILKIEEELLALKIDLSPEKIPNDEGFSKITKEELENNYKKLEDESYWGSEEELFELLGCD